LAWFVLLDLQGLGDGSHCCSRWEIVACRRLLVDAMKGLCLQAPLSARPYCPHQSLIRKSIYGKNAHIGCRRLRGFPQPKRRVLLSAGLDDLLIADCGPQALNILEIFRTPVGRCTIDMVVLDFSMPQMDGVEVCGASERTKAARSCRSLY
jgi:hypothetical protein